MIRRLLTLAVVALVVAGAPAPGFATATFQFFELCVGTSCNFLDVTPAPGANVSVNIAGTYTLGTSTFTIRPSGTSVTPTVFGIDSTLDRIGLTNAVIAYAGNTGPVNLTIDFGFAFTPAPTPTTYGVQMAGAFKRGTGTALATGDSASATGDVLFPGDELGRQIDGPLSYTVVTSNTFVPPKPPAGTGTITCPTTSTCTSDTLEMLVTLHFAQPGDSVAVPNSFVTVSCVEDPTLPDCATRVQEFLDAEAAADAAALPEPDTLALFLGSGLVGLGLSRLKQVRGRARQDQRD
jgi:hypothetical protein